MNFFIVNFELESLKYYFLNFSQFFLLSFDCLNFSNETNEIKILLPAFIWFQVYKKVFMINVSKKFKITRVFSWCDAQPQNIKINATALKQVRNFRVRQEKNLRKNSNYDSETRSEILLYGELTEQSPAEAKFHCQSSNFLWEFFFSFRTFKFRTFLVKEREFR